MDYLIFRTEVEKRLKDFLPENLKDCSINFTKVQKVNEELDAVTIVPKGKHMGPTIYINMLYDVYKFDNDFDLTLSSFVNSLVNHMDEMEEIDGSFLESEETKKRITFNLINTKANEEYLKEIPNRAFLDLSIIYRIMLDNNEKSLMSTVVTNSIAEKMGLTEDELFRLAVSNTEEINGIMVESMSDMLKEMQDLEPGFDLPEWLEGPVMHIITNRHKAYGASAILYEKELHELAEKLKSDLYLIPSSIHEWVVLLADGDDPYVLAKMVHDINITEVDVRDRLSNNVYHYDRELRKITVATDIPLDIRE